MSHFAVFGTHPRLSLAEFRAVAPSPTPPRLCGQAAVFSSENWDGAVLMNTLGGTVKLGDVHDESSVEEIDAARIVDLLAKFPRSDRVIFGYTVYGGTPAARNKLEKLPIAIKRELKSRGKSARWVTSEGDEPLSPAAVAKLRLTTEGYDIALLVQGGERVSIGLTTHVQDADAWSERDFGRPARDDENGMLPPKLARIMVNLAGVKDGVIADPFCGSGTVLMEAALATKAKHLIGSDIDKQQVEMSRHNTEWLIDQRILRPEDKERFTYYASDVRLFRSHSNPPVNAIVTEGYLGPALRGHESETILKKNADEITALWKDALRELKSTLAKGAKLVCIWPAMKTSHGQARVNLETDLEELGYKMINPLGDWDTSDGPLLYYRPGQRVMRRIVVLERKG